MADDRQNNQDGQASKSGGNRLPPPAFPPGHRAQARTNHRTPAPGRPEAESDVPDEAFISPDEPIVRTGSRFASDAFISPDAPLPPREAEGQDEGIVTGLGDDAHMGREDIATSRQSDPAVADLAARVSRLADALQSKGEAALRTTPDMSKFEATLRAYCVGYLAHHRDSGGA